MELALISLGLNLLRGANNAGNAPAPVEKDYTIYYVVGAAGFVILLLLLIVIINKNK
jgi:uncharacterized integral membrane protein